MEKLEAVFPGTFSYYIEKIFENIGKQNNVKLGLMHVKLVKKVMDKLKESLQKRDIYDSIKDLYEPVEYAIRELELYFDKSKTKEEPRINDKTAYIFTCFIREHSSELKEIAKEIDSK